MQRDTFEIREFPSLAAYQGEKAGSLRVLIATEEIIGPVRNGGIASTYYHLARGLAARGHKVTVLYLKGREVENETPEHWVEHYAKFGIEFVPLADFEENVAGTSTRWQSRWLAFYRWLSDRDEFDVVHNSEWRGGAFYCLQAKRMGLAFADTLFVTKTSSPYIWNRHYQMRTIDSPELSLVSFAEQKCVEWADIVVGGSAHLLSFMDHIGYQLPEDRCYVQPNIVDFSEVKVDDKREQRDFGDIVKTSELVFFGRLEPRKGLDLFVFALDSLVARGVQPERVTFLGKPGERLPGQDGITPLELIEKFKTDWPFPVDVVTDLNQPEALSLMCSRDVIAVMPSLIENSTMAVYETLVHKIPFIATSVGGTPELVAPQDHETTLCKPTVQALAKRLEAALTNGQPVAHPAFDNDENLNQWYGFHNYLSANGAEALLHSTETATEPQGVAYLACSNDAENLFAAIECARSTVGIDEIAIGCTFRLEDAHRSELERLTGCDLIIEECVGLSAGEVFNHLRDRTKADILIFDAEGVTSIDRNFVSDLRTALGQKPRDFVTALFHFDPDGGSERNVLLAPFGADPAAQSQSGLAYGPEFIVGLRDNFFEIGAFETVRVNSGIVHEFVTRAALQECDLFVIPKPYLRINCAFEEFVKDDGIHAYLERKPMLDKATLPIRKLLLGQERQLTAPENRGRIIVGQAHRAKGKIAWLTNAGKVGDPLGELQPRHRMMVGFDRSAAAIRFTCFDIGQLSITANDKPVRLEADFGKRYEVTTGRIEILPLLDRTGHLKITIEHRRPKTTRTENVLVQRIENDVYYIGAHGSIFWDDAFDTALARLGGENKSASTISKPALHKTKPALATQIRTILHKGRR